MLINAEKKNKNVHKDDVHEYRKVQKKVDDMNEVAAKDMSRTMEETYEETTGSAGTSAS